MGSEKAIEMFVNGLVLDPNTQAPVVILKDESGKIQLPIWIGIAEATSIASAIKQINMARPLTHDLMQDIFNQSGVAVMRVVITDLTDSTYFAEIILSQGDKAIIVDSRPSDAIALALRTSAPIFVVENVLEKAQGAFSESKAQVPAVSSQEEDAAQESSEADDEEEGKHNFSEIDKDKWNEILADLDPEDFKYKM